MADDLEIYTIGLANRVVLVRAKPILISYQGRNGGSQLTKSVAGSDSLHTNTIIDSRQENAFMDLPGTAEVIQSGAISHVLVSNDDDKLQDHAAKPRQQDERAQIIGDLLTKGLYTPKSERSSLLDSNKVHFCIEWVHPECEHRFAVPNVLITSSYDMNTDASETSSRNLMATEVVPT